ncbi:MAG: UDP-N-acetylmuramoyl-L-alanyl-D-glutamate--2,6-diaminopimelate ligase, partial [bacterium]|nr:UDP-N-acetylmuramoyl-L-alanyl-D-glutamate--2,6-diaminopimelate ligase [bacterium]
MKNLKLLLNGDDIIAVSGNLDTVVSGVTNDSRKVEKGFCFIAIKGFRQDGLKFIEDAVKKGAQSIVTESAPLEKYNHICWIQVKNDRHAFSKLAARFYDNIPQRFYTIGVTGTNGKT